MPGGHPLHRLPAAQEGAEHVDRQHPLHPLGGQLVADLAARVNDLLLPLVKGCGSERAFTLLGTESLQTFGGSGFLQEYPLEQYVRDAKIDTLYEGTTAIQGQDFFFRKIVKDQGRALGHLAKEIEGFIAAALFSALTFGLTALAFRRRVRMG